jgi:hypothetical protein
MFSGFALARCSSRPCDVDLPSDAVQFTKRALELYYDSDPTNQLVTFSSTVTWDDVSKTAAEARQEHQNDTTLGSVVNRVKQAKADYSSKGRLHKIGRSLGDIAPAIVHKLDFAPDQMYVNTIC